MKTRTWTWKYFLLNATIVTLLSSAAIFIAGVPASSQESMQTASDPSLPVAPVRPVTETLYGVSVTDQYRYMENLKDPAVAQWFKDEDTYTRSVLERIPGRDALLADIKKYDRATSAQVFNVSELPGDIYFYQKELAQESVAKLFVRHGLDGEETLLLDPEKFEKKGGPQWAISYYSPSFDGRYVAVGVAAGGSENTFIHVIELANGQETGEAIDRARFGGVSWRADNHSFFYNRLQEMKPGMPETEQEVNSRIYIHIVGTDPSRDRVVFGNGVLPDVTVAPIDIPIMSTDPESSYALAILIHGVQNEWTVYAAPVDTVGTDATPWKKIVDVDDDVTGVAFHGDDLYVLSHQDASRYKLLRMSLSHPDFEHAEVVLPPGRAVLQYSATAKDALYVQELDGGIARLLRIPYTGGAPEEVQLPFAGTLSIESADSRLPGLAFDLTGWMRASTIYAYDPETRAVTDTHLQPLGPYDAPNDLEAVEVQVPSYDGTMVPLAIVYKRGTKLDGANPTLLTAYGSYGISTLPNFAALRLAWFERGGIRAFASVRGGGEYGEDWHKAGMKLTKANTWRDFIACAQYLIQHKYTSPQRLAIEGGSAGGITVGRFVTERPDLIAAAIDEVGVSNPLRTEFSPNGPPNIPEFGSVQTQEGFEDLYAMDSYQHVRDGVKYPAVLLTTGWNDPRVSSWEPGKMTARLQAATTSGRPILLRVEYNGGHGGIGGTKEQNELFGADEISFLFWQFGMPGFQPN
jgi:prolyl oligopeptidase